MNYKVGYIIFVFFLSVAMSANAQVQFNFNGLGRAIVTSNKMDGPLLQGDSLSPSKGVSGYTLFDLQPNLIINNNIRANAILRLRNPFGSFFGANTAFAFRQFQIMGKIGKVVDYEIGDIYVGETMTKYTVFQPVEIFHEYESDIHKMRRGLLEYENFVSGNLWRLQGVQGKSVLGFDKGIKALAINAFGTRTNATNDRNIPDRLLVGGRVGVMQSKYLTLGINYASLMDVQIRATDFEYSNSVITGDVKFTVDKEKFLVQADAEYGGSTFKNVQVSDDSTVTYSDNVFDAGLKAVYKPFKLKLFGNYRYVGAQFSSPSAQTARLNVDQNVLLFDRIANNSAVRPQNLFDRLTDEQVYNRSISQVLYNYLPHYGNLSPYGAATPNRVGMTFGIGTDTSAKVISAEVKVDLFNEIVGEGVEEKRKFTSLRGGVLFNAGTLLKWEKKTSLNLGVRHENTTRGGLATVDLKSLLVDVGGSFEVLKNLDLLLGVKMLTAKGNEYLSLRDQFNLLVDFPEYSIDLTENIYSFGARIRFSERSYFTVNYNTTGYKEIVTPNFNYSINQLFGNYTLIF